MTSTGLVLGPLALALLWLPTGWSLTGLLVACLFGDASIVNLGARPVPVGWFVALLVIARFLWRLARGHTLLRLDILRKLLPLALLVLDCTLVLVLALTVFKGVIMVMPGSAALDPLLAEPYRLMPENINQLVYLYLVFVLVLAVAHLGAELAPAELVAALDRGMRWSCAIATLATSWHIASFATGVWFPADFFHSGAHSEAWDQSVGGVQRPSGPFAEPSTLAYFYTMLGFYFFQRWRATAAVGDQIYFIISVVVLILSTSTSGYLLLAVLVGMAAADALLGHRRPRLGAAGRRRGLVLRRAHLVSGLVLAAATAGLAWFLMSHSAMLTAILDEQVLNKKDSLSYEVRSHADHMAWQVFLETYGLGLGLGSHRPSSGLLTLLCGTGAAGTLAFLCFILTALRDPPPAAGAGSEALKPLRWAALGLLVCHLITGPDIQSVPLWTCIAAAIAIGVRGTRQAAARSPRLSFGAAAAAPGRPPQPRLA